MELNMIVIWFAALVIFLIAEAVTTTLVSAWFALGALGALLVALIWQDLFWTQIITFLVISGVTLFFTRPIALKYFNSHIKRTNADRVLDMTGVVKEEINNIAGTGSVFVGGKLWTARSDKGEVIPEDTLVTAIRIEGVKLIVAEQTAKAEEITI